MNKVLLLTTNPNAMNGDFWTSFRRIERSLTSERSNWLRATTAEEADIILFTDPTDSLLRDVRQHSIYKAHREKAMVNCDHDVAYPLVPGLYTSLRQGRFNPRWSEGGYYVKVLDHEWVIATPLVTPSRHLCSFVGTFDTHPIRECLARIDRSDVFVRDTSSGAGRLCGQSTTVYDSWKREYAQSLCDSAFILCPRGVAPSSYRIFEAMKAGRVPVIISDDWVAPVGPAWEQFSLRVAERHIARVAEVCAANADRAADMGQLAAIAFTDYFSIESCATTILDRCMAIKSRCEGNIRRNQFSAALNGLTDLAMIRRTVVPAAKKWLTG